MLDAGVAVHIGRGGAGGGGGGGGGIGEGEGGGGSRGGDAGGAVHLLNLQCTLAKVAASFGPTLDQGSEKAPSVLSWMEDKPKSWIQFSPETRYANIARQTDCQISCQTDKEVLK